MCQSQNKGGIKTTTTGFVDFPTQCQRQDNSDEDRIDLAQFFSDPVLDLFHDKYYWEIWKNTQQGNPKPHVHKAFLEEQLYLLEAIGLDFWSKNITQECFNLYLLTIVTCDK